MKVDVVVKFQCVGPLGDRGCGRVLFSLIRDAEVLIADPRADHPCSCGGELRFIEAVDIRPSKGDVTL